MAKKPLLALLVPCLLFGAIGSASAYEYTCRDRRTGTVVDHPISRDKAKEAEETHAGWDCDRKGEPITSGRDQYREQQGGRDNDWGRDNGWGHGPRHQGWGTSDDRWDRRGPPQPNVEAITRNCANRIWGGRFTGIQPSGPGTFIATFSKQHGYGRVLCEADSFGNVLAVEER